MPTPFFSQPATGSSVTISGIPTGSTDLVIDLVGVSHNRNTTATLRMAVSADGVSWSAPSAVAAFNKAWPYIGHIVLAGYEGDLGVASRIQPDNMALSLAAFVTDFGWVCPGGVQHVKLSWSAGSFDAGTINATVR
jgi:hypothetical protein